MSTFHQSCRAVITGWAGLDKALSRAGSDLNSLGASSPAGPQTSSKSEPEGPGPSRRRRRMMCAHIIVGCWPGGGSCRALPTGARASCQVPGILARGETGQGRRQGPPQAAPPQLVPVGPGRVRVLQAKAASRSRNSAASKAPTLAPTHGMRPSTRAHKERELSVLSAARRQQTPPPPAQPAFPPLPPASPCACRVTAC